MPIKLGTRRRGSLAVEALMVVPIALIMVLLSRFVAETLLTRHEVAVYARGSAGSAAALASVNPLACTFDTSGFQGPPGVNRNGSARCEFTRAEAGLRQEDPFFAALRSGSQGWTALADGVDPKADMQDIYASGSGMLAFDRPPFLQRQTTGSPGSSFLRPNRDTWDHSDRNWATGHDPEVWRELRQRSTYRLFPNVFPSRNR
ncbi:MAG: hypothetical protein AAGF74_11240 [Pseudomonadota bacterium]